jgi:hypothetical protein
MSGKQSGAKQRRFLLKIQLVLQIAAAGKQKAKFPKYDGKDVVARNRQTS